MIDAEGQMNDKTFGFVFVGFWKRVVAALIDAAIGVAFLPITVPLMKWSFGHRTIFPQVVWSVVWTVVWLWLVVRFGGTPGKLAIGARIVNAEGRFLSWGNAVLRVLPGLVISANSLLRMAVTMRRYPDSAPHSSFMEIGRLMNEYAQPYSTIALVLSLFIYIDIGVILFNRQKRAIHDFIAGSYVITRDSYRAVGEPGPDRDAMSALRVGEAVRDGESNGCH
jgi:uncharacterized RDD family membrane protein YckC